MKIVHSLCLLLLLPTLLSGQLTEEIETYLTEVNKFNEVPGSAVAILKGDELIYEGYFGLAEMNHRVPVSKKTMFRVYSSTKLLVSVALFQLVDAGKIEMSDPIGKYLPELPDTWQTRKIRDLIAHASGLPDFKFLKEGVTEEEMLEQLRDEPLSFAAGDRFSYNQTNYWLLGRIIETTSGKSLQDFIRDGQFEGDASSFVFSSEALRVVPNRTGVYHHSADGWMLAGDSAGKFAHGANGLAITLPGLIGWAKRHSQGRFMGAAAGAEMVSAYEYSNSDHKFLHGWGVYPVNGYKSRGFTGGQVSGVRYFPDQDLTILFLSNGFRYGLLHNRVINHLAGMIDEKLKDPYWDQVEYIAGQFLGREDIPARINEFMGWRMLNINAPVEGDINSVGYILAREGRLEDALAIFRLNTELYPNAFNVWDSLGECHEMLGETEEALKYYKKSVALNPENTHGIEKIKLLSNSKK